ncbi:hypothetical protein AQPE_4930 [Aquipluma nitroreducens]|uniref:Uncharacterized protein n=1 Tax=Aquipluma nitroreducens TaxID=2010828 RepID=A0A5K7SGV7_9BACT|nr:hypothetical protein AQPE_4930 [Aquipluma nitroreducens]
MCIVFYKNAIIYPFNKFKSNYPLPFTSVNGLKEDKRLGL